MKLSIRAQAVIGIGMIEVVMLIVLLYSVFHFIDSSTTDEVERRAQSIARIFAATAADDVLSLDLGSLQSLLMLRPEPRNRICPRNRLQWPSSGRELW